MFRDLPKGDRLAALAACAPPAGGGHDKKTSGVRIGSADAFESLTVNSAGAIYLTLNGTFVAAATFRMPSSRKLARRH